MKQKRVKRGNILNMKVNPMMTVVMTVILRNIIQMMIRNQYSMMKYLIRKRSLKEERKIMNVKLKKY